MDGLATCKAAEHPDQNPFISNFIFAASAYYLKVQPPVKASYSQWPPGRYTFRSELR